MSIGANEYYLNLHLAAEDREEERYPHCDKCGNAIYDEHYYEINGDLLCEDCMNDKYRFNTDDYYFNHY